MYFDGQMTYHEAKALMQDIFGAGFLNPKKLMLLAVEILNFNQDYQYGGFTRFEAFKTNDGNLFPLPSRYQSIFPLAYAE